MPGRERESRAALQGLVVQRRDGRRASRERQLGQRVQRDRLAPAALSITILFVTHDQQEAVDRADAVVLMLDGLWSSKTWLRALSCGLRRRVRIC